MLTCPSRLSMSVSEAADTSYLVLHTCHSLSNITAAVCDALTDSTCFMDTAFWILCNGHQHAAARAVVDLLLSLREPFKIVHTSQQAVMRHLLLFVQPACCLLHPWRDKQDHMQRCNLNSMCSMGPKF